MNFLKQNTAAEIIIGPILDCVDGKTPVEVLTLADITAAIYKNSARTVITLTASGGADRLKITLRDDDVFLAVVEDFMIQPEAVYNVAPATPTDITNSQAVIVDAIDDKPVTPVTDISGLALAGEAAAALIDYGANKIAPATPQNVTDAQTAIVTAIGEIDVSGGQKPSRPDIG
jgi:hypothetical protein